MWRGIETTSIAVVLAAQNEILSPLGNSRAAPVDTTRAVGPLLGCAVLTSIDGGRGRLEQERVRLQGGRLAGSDRHDWSTAARDQFYGHETPFEDPSPVHRQAVAVCRATLIEAYQLSRDAASANETTKQMLDLLTPVENADAAPADAPMRVVLMGRTMAGKSTLLAALTGGWSERIGDGRQRYSRDVLAAPALELDNVDIVDTPGVGAKDGEDDVALAMAQVPGADLILWVASNDSFQEETAQALRAVAFRGKPVVVALNCRERLDDDLDREDFLEDQDSVFAQHEGHFSTIRSHLAAAAVHPVAEVMLHAEAARLALTDGDSGLELREASRLGRLLAVLEQEGREHRTARRILREADEVRTQALVLTDTLAAIEQETREIVYVSRGMREDQDRRTTRLVNACRQKMADDVIRIVGSRQGWYQTVTDFGPKVAEQWEKQQAVLMAELDQALRAHGADLERAMDDASAETEHEWTTAVRRHVNVAGLRDFRGLWKGRAAGAAVGAGGALVFMAIGGAVGLVAGPLGTVVGGLAGLTINLVGAFLVTPLRKKVQSFFTSKGDILEANRELLQTEIGEVLAELEGQVLAEVNGTIARVLENLSNAFTRRAKAESDALAVADLLAHQRWVVGSAISTLDHATACCLLRADNRPRLAESIGKVTRLPGVCVAIEVTPEALAEAWLFPPSSPEVLTFGRTPFPVLPGGRATSYVLGLTEEVPASIRCSPDSTVVATKAPVPNQVLEAWSATLSDHLDSQVKILRPIEPGV